MENQRETSSISGCFLRTYWMILGNFALFICAAIIANKHVSAYFTLSAVDAVYWAFALTAGLAKFTDVRWFKGQTSMGEPATMKDVVRYEAILAVVAVAVWILAHVIAKAHS